MNEKKILYVAKVAKKHICQCHIPTMKMLQEWGYTVHVGASNDFNDNEKNEISHCDKFFDVSFCKKPYSLKNITAYRQIKKIISENDYQLIHCHTPVAAAITRLAAARVAKDTVVLYTTHGFHFYIGAKKSSIIYYVIEKVLAHITDGIVAINAEDYDAANRICSNIPCETYYIHGMGVDVEKIKCANVDKTQFKRKLGIPSDSFVLLSVSELNKNKNLKTTLRAMSMIKDSSIYYVICGEGDMSDEYQRMAVDLGIEERVIFTGYRHDIFEVVHIADIFLFPSIREGLGMAPLEAMSAGVPIIGSDIRGVREYARDGINGFYLNPYDVKGFCNAIIKLKNDDELRITMGRNAANSVAPFDIKKSLPAIATIYKNYLEI